jgi:hypothetical protein
MKVLLPAILSGVASRKDGSYSVKFDTRELGADAAMLFSQMNSEGWLLFAPNELSEKDVPAEKADSMTGQKTQAQRVRGTAYVLWEKKGKPGDFDTFYRSTTEWFIDLMKEKIDQL